MAPALLSQPSLQAQLVGAIGAVDLGGFMSYWRYALMGVAMGAAVDRGCQHIKRRVPNRYAALALQLTLLCLVPTLLNATGLASFVLAWQTGIAGLFFAGMFLGAQGTILTTLS